MASLEGVAILAVCSSCGEKYGHSNALKELVLDKTYCVVIEGVASWRVHAMQGQYSCLQLPERAS